ncbi:MAG TPA: DUF6600 domain-containing protein [Polyangia bacterium]|nr:DUF6600 domain-containing protein [Polyangia bacterium]
MASLKHALLALLVTSGWASVAAAQTYAPQPNGLQEVPPYPPDQVYGPMTEQGVPVDVNVSGDYDPNLANPQPEYDVSADNGAAERYDDGYDPQAYAQFDSSLSPYGAWVDDPTYGRVWVPSSAVVGGGFTPYASNGHWAMTEYGWTWASDWDWGWAPFHFGRWAVMSGLGWGWVPGTLWGPAWVSWRSGGGYVGWAALPPRGTSIGRPVGAQSPWRFTSNENLAARQPYLTSATLPGGFARMSVVSTQRRLPGAGSTVVMNAGPTNLGRAPERLASVAPGALPRVAIEGRVGTPVSFRPWVQSRNRSRPTQYRAPSFERSRASGGAQPYRTAPQQRPAFTPAGRGGAQRR